MVFPKNVVLIKQIESLGIFEKAGIIFTLSEVVIGILGSVSLLYTSFGDVNSK
jgi:hypothetical protein